MPSQSQVRIAAILEEMRRHGADTDARTAHMWQDLGALSAFLGDFLNATAMDRKSAALGMERIEEAIRRVEAAVTRLEKGVSDSGSDVSQVFALAKETVRYAQRIPRMHDATVDGLIEAKRARLAADGARTAAEEARTATVSVAAKQSRLTQSSIDMLVDLRQQQQAPKPAVIEHEVADSDIVSEEPAPDNVIRLPRTALGMIATVGLLIATSMSTIALVPFSTEARPTAECHQVEDANRQDLYDCGSGHLWVATKVVTNPNGGVDLDLKPEDD